MINKINNISMLLFILCIIALPILLILLVWGLIEYDLLFKIIMTDIILLFIFSLIKKITDND